VAGVEVGSLRRNPGAAALVGVAMAAAATAFGCLTWDGRDLVVPVAWLLAAVLGASLVAGLQGGVVAAFAATASLGFAFSDPRWSLRVDDAADVRATAALAVVGLLVVLAIDAVDTARQRAADALGEEHRSLVLLDGVLDDAPVGIALLDRELRFVRVNEELLRMNGLPFEAHVGRDVGEVLGDERVVDAARRVLATGRPVLDERFSAPHRETGEVLHVAASYYPVRGEDGEVAGVGAVVHDVTREVLVDAEREVLLARVARLQLATSALAQARTTDDVVDAVLAQVRPATGADSGSLSLVQGDELVVLAGHGYDAELLGRWSRFALDAPVPLAEAVRTGRVIVAGSRDEIVERWPDLDSELDEGEHALAALPLVVEDEVIGAIGLSTPARRAYDADELAFLEAIAAQCSQALRRAALKESDRLSRDRLAFLAEATAAFTSTLDLDATLGRLADLAVPAIADWCAVYLLEGDAVRPVTVAHVEPERADAVRRLVERYPIDLGAPVGAGAVIRTGTAELYRELPVERLHAIAQDEEHLATLLEVGFTSALVVPLRTKDRTLGALALATSGGRRLGDDELSLATDVARRAAQAALNAELFQERARIADVLQRSLLPPTAVAIPGVDLATRFVPVGEGVDVGGDFYDVFRLGTAGTPSDAYAVVIGDVRGKGSEAAAIAAAARHSIRTSGLRTTSPAAMLRELNEVLLVLADEDADGLEPLFCTAAVAVVRPDGDRIAVTLAVGGHPLPMLLCGDGTTHQVGRPGSLIGVIDDPVLVDDDFEVGRGEAVVLYTDGVTERHAGDRFFDEDGLAAAVSRCAGFTAETMAERIELAARAFVEDEPRDDLAILVLRVPTRTGTASSASADLPLDASAPRLARRFLGEVFAAFGRHDLVDPGTLLVSELVTNAVLHGVAPLRVTIEPTASHVRVAVADAGEGRPELQHVEPESTSGRGILLVHEVSDRWGVDDLPSGGKAVWFDLA
jgi:PAS domain S-box-containing protein